MDGLGLAEPVAVTLVRRGYRTVEAAGAFLAAADDHDPFLFKAMAEVCDRLHVAITTGRLITVHGDYDVDGVCSTAILVRAIRELGGNCDWLIPGRLEDGYGLTQATVERLAGRGTAMLLTTDCGIGSVDEVGSGAGRRHRGDRDRPPSAGRRVAAAVRFFTRRSRGTRSPSSARPGSRTSSRRRCAASARPRPTWTWSRWRPLPISSRCGARTERSSGGDWRSPGAPGAPASAPFWPLPPSRPSASTRATSPSGSGRGSTLRAGSTAPTQGSS